MTRAFYRDQRIDTAFRASFCDLGNTTLRLYQRLEGDSPIADGQDDAREGMNHLCLYVDNLEDSLAELATAGIAWNWRAPELAIAFLETTAIGGMTFALVES
jgi:hypothetical protein